jgi:hypothetical protein
VLAKRPCAGRPRVISHVHQEISTHPRHLSGLPRIDAFIAQGHGKATDRAGREMGFLARIKANLNSLGSEAPASGT